MGMMGMAVSTVCHARLRNPDQISPARAKFNRAEPALRLNPRISHNI
jgi:hypothetical protein